MSERTSDTQSLRERQAVEALVGESSAFLKSVAEIRRLAAVDATVLIEGETGTGKELAGRAIHYLSSRGPMPFVPVNCGALPDTLAEAELFGHERGAFTDAQQERLGLIRAAEGGTLCLDEVGSLSSRAQVILLRLLQDKTYRVVGSVREQRANVRFLAMSNTPLVDLVRGNFFRTDLYYRLCVFTIQLPPLRERRQDIIPLAFHFLRKYARPHQPVVDISTAAHCLLESHDWPGNVRELENAMHRAAQMAATACIDTADLWWPGMDAAGHVDDRASPHANFRMLKRRTVEMFERSYLTSLMARCHGNVSQAARVAGKERRDLGRLLKKHHMLPKAFAG